MSLRSDPACEEVIDMSDHFGIPGIGGSLGQCALCGKDFLLEILLNKSVKSFTIDGVKQTLYGHDDCLKKYTGTLDALDLPVASPLRQAFERAKEHPASATQPA